MTNPENTSEQATPTTVGFNAIGELTTKLYEFFVKHQRISAYVALFFILIFSLKVFWNIVAAINSFFFLSPFFELVGVFTVARFIYCHLWKKSSRDEFFSKISIFKRDVVGEE